jgi:oxysterol-binding protein-related protein 8
LLNSSSDGQTPEEQCKQILAITPIVKGQKPDGKYDIPSRQSLEQKRASHEVSRQTASTADSGHGDLIDLGGPSASTSAPAQAQQKASVQGNENVAVSGSPAPPHPSQSNPSAVETYHQELKEMLPGVQNTQGAGVLPQGNKITRTDSNNSQLDEFVDADDGLNH